MIFSSATSLWLGLLNNVSCNEAFNLSQQGLKERYVIPPNSLFSYKKCLFCELILFKTCDKIYGNISVLCQNANICKLFVYL